MQQPPPVLSSKAIAGPGKSIRSSSSGNPRRASNGPGMSPISYSNPIKQIPIVQLPFHILSYALT